jgi:hypothetical protein
VPPSIRRPFRAAAVPLLYRALTVVVGCAWSVPADPGRNALLRSRDTTDAGFLASTAAPGRAQAIGGAASDDGARTLYLSKCGQCHAPWPATHATAAQWPGFVAKYGPRAGLFGADRERVLRWLQANAP